MAIDDPLDQAEAQAATTPSLPAKMLATLEIVPIPGLNQVAAVQKWLDRRAEANQSYLIEVLNAELRRVRARLEDHLFEKHPEFWGEDYPALLLDGLSQDFHFGPGTVTGIHPRCAEYHVFSR